MASAFAHALSAYALSRVIPLSVGATFPEAAATPPKGVLRKNSRLLFDSNPRVIIALGIFCAVIPDADVIAFGLGIPYEHVLGHRGITHSFVFAVALGILLTALFFRPEKYSPKQRTIIAAYLIVATASHSMLDALTTGGLGVAFFAPFDNSRYFFPWRVIKVSPIGVGKFFSEWGLRVLKSELVWVGIPSVILIAARGLYLLIARRLIR